jgi:tetratricopeptide (TPR) repeat protein
LLGVLFNRAGNTAKAAGAFEQAEQLYRLANSLEGSIELAFQRGSSASARDEFEAAASYLRSALETARIAGNIQQEVRIKLYLSTNAYRSGDAAAAEQYSREALNLARANRIDPLAVRGLLTLGSAYNRKGDTSGGERYYQEALIGALHDSAAKFNLSEPEAAEALAFYQPNRFARESVQCLTILGRARLWPEDFHGALEYFQRASVAAQSIQDQSLMALTEESLGTVFYAQQRYPEALPHFRKELDLSVTNERQGYAGLNIAEMFVLLGRYEEALQALGTAEARAAKFPSLSLKLKRVRAQMALTQGHYVESSKTRQSSIGGRRWQGRIVARPVGGHRGSRTRRHRELPARTGILPGVA